jgi:hypothetical protein
MQRDLSLLTARGVDVVFAPTPSEMYPNNPRALALDTYVTPIAVKASCTHNVQLAHNVDRTPYVCAVKARQAPSHAQHAAWIRAMCACVYTRRM